MSQLLDLDALMATPLAEEPYPWTLLPHALRGQKVARTLEAEFPTRGFRTTERRGGAPGGKGYHTRNLTLVADGGAVAAGLSHLSPRWRELVAELSSPAYRRAVEELTGRPLDGARLAVRAVRYGPGGWIDPHTDRADKLVTQTWYFNSGWRDGWAGSLRILRSPDPADAAADIIPRLGQSVVLVPSDRSWHAVTPVSAAATEERKTLLVHFVAP
ncbi:2OG-Fe(II) oxygenase [Streptomyces tsukubensis]|uniref:Fe2OG dioxygenase domain-containing protein n=1 Tax=Streptomyces tsukubensis TaxID=83656 RepID=A0A1V4AFD8_9ACTN|nr:2OG-Fe(II) oxygenase [Streptomyces tsukubensis]OON82754.1 hypothetical protein B1H18_01565 [Streptomyces tsukubensis]QFR92070.1 2OG-Fe(II) oxygenase [Streptomyces tsukubensis]